MIRKVLPLTFLCLFVAASAAWAAPANFSDLYKKASPAVVNINTEKTVQVQRSPFPFPSPFEDFFGQGNSPFGNFYDSQPRNRQQRAMGSGFIISADGYIVTNYHVVDGADSIKVNLDETHGKDVSFAAELIGGDPETDIALLKIKSNDPLPYLKFGDSDALEVGDWLVAIGNPFGLDHTMTAGILSAKGRNIRSGPFDSFLQTDASINPGNSGGPLLNMDGEVIGINTAIIAGGQGIGFAIPSNMAQDIVATLRVDRKMSRGWLGVTIQSLDEKSAKALGLPNDKGALIGDVLPGNPAAKAGLQAGDVITAIDGKPIVSSDELLRTIAALKPGDKVAVTIWRGGKHRELKATLSERGTENAETSSKNGAVKNGSIVDMLGLRVRPLSSDEASRMRLDGVSGLLVTGVESRKPAAEAGLRRGDIILSVNGEAVESVSAFSSLLESQGKSRGAAMFHVSRQGQKFFTTLEVPKN